MYTGLLHLHSLLRYIILLLLIITIVKSLMGWLQKKDYTEGDNKFALYTMIGVHLQLLIGLVLYFISPLISTALKDFGAAMGDTVLRFWAVEHSVMMILAVIVITIGRSKAKKAATALRQHQLTFWFFLIGLLLILISIPWPFREALNRGWF